MRLRRRRRPAGVERVPTEVLTPEVVELRRGPTVLRLGPGRGLLDLPGGRNYSTIVTVWPDPDTGRWAETAWPRDPTYGWFVAPIDLRLGHILEFRSEIGDIPGWVVEADRARVLIVIEADREQASSAAKRALVAWELAEIQAVESTWKSRLVRE